MSPSASKKRQTTNDHLDADRLAAYCKALAHPARVRILKILIERDACVCGEIVEAFSFAQSTVSEHLRILKAAGLVVGEVDGPRICYCVDKKAIAELKAIFAGLHV